MNRLEYEKEARELRKKNRDLETNLEIEKLKHLDTIAALKDVQRKFELWKYELSADLHSIVERVGQEDFPF